MLKKILLLVTIGLVTMCATPSPAKPTWPLYEKKNFLFECSNSMMSDPELQGTFDPEIIKNICSCVADAWENSYDWETFVQLSSPPLTEEVEMQFYATSYFCAMQMMLKYQT